MRNRKRLVGPVAQRFQPRSVNRSESNRCKAPRNSSPTSPSWSVSAIRLTMNASRAWSTRSGCPFWGRACGADGMIRAAGRDAVSASRILPSAAGDPPCPSRWRPRPAAGGSTGGCCCRRWPIRGRSAPRSRRWAAHPGKSAPSDSPDEGRRDSSGCRSRALERFARVGSNSAVPKTFA